MTSTVRRLLVIIAVVFAIATPAFQAIGHLGLSAAEFASEGNGTLRAAGYAFSIWSLIYLGLIAYAVWQALPRNALDPVLARLAAPSIVAISGCGLWIIASALNWRWASVVIISLSAATLTVALMRAARITPSPDLRSRLLVWWPLSLISGWLTIATAINILTVLTAEGLLAGAGTAAALAGIVVVLVVALLVLRTRRLGVYGAPIAWGLVGVWVAEHTSKGDVAALALGAACLIAAFALWQSRPSASPR